MSFEVVEIILSFEIIPDCSSVYEHIFDPTQIIYFFSSRRWNIIVLAVAYLIWSFLAAYQIQYSVSYFFNFKPFLEYQSRQLILRNWRYFNNMPGTILERGLSSFFQGDLDS
ncbi:unnamed protein product (macronuclear) [Paramecium tetraurelia]|uniref:ABC transmembrane type-1 domain-containing protein n=1 Tax=Paramecium tetraurelia TaxID=5888 RepID=A0DL73_PARTE|nr:uncharacterized protein GSPATT00018107001 [Paramecium tetraurelia]CAK83790.1 unnamed protein product [Paramecium tetraurelia]|eukprot:XP_001451187.1 hypothetical protein (macronuclear) [Paramecium tetraurelia strain d4-2]